MQLDLVYGKRLHRKFFRDLSLYDLLSYVNNNFASDPKDLKLVIKYYFFFNRAVVS